MFVIDSQIKKQMPIEVIQFVNQQFDSYHEDFIIEKLQFDTRKLIKGDFFIALKDQRDGHEFILDAYEKGAKGIIIELKKKEEVYDRLKNQNLQQELWIILTPDNLEFLKKSATIKRSNFKGKTISVLGSNGKTTTKDFLFQMLGFFNKKVYATPGNWNNHIGLPITLFNAPLDLELLILEMGMNRHKEIQDLAKIAQPDIALITSIGREHMEFFKDQEDVAKAELEVLEGLKENSHFYYPLNAPLKDYVQNYCKENNLFLNFFDLKDQNLEEWIEPNIKKNIALLKKNQIFWKDFVLENPRVLHLGMLSNFFLAFLVCYHMYLQNATRQEIYEFLEYTKNISILSKQRFEFFKFENTLIIDDSYNANPDSFLMAIKSLRNLFPNEKLGCFAGYMAELGHYSKEGHKEVGKALRENSIDLLGICGKEEVKNILKGYQNESVPYFSNSELLAKNLRNQNLSLLMKNYKAILIKGSRSSKMEEITKIFWNSHV
ncbi:MAG: UDP-N-acetylmuramoyl-tripeptide--D-alanyl-D-alanine ligase [Leptonema sp. (in: bacteria)]